jgi:CheY-like chemotaxis protein
LNRQWATPVQIDSNAPSASRIAKDITGSNISTACGAHMPETAAKTKVLIVDDERVIADTLTAILNHSGFDARAAYSCGEALEIAPVFSPDLLISDVIMAERSGIEAAIRIKKMLPDIRVFLLSGQTATTELLEKEKADGYGFEVVMKPVHPSDLITRLRECIAA